MDPLGVEPRLGFDESELSRVARPLPCLGVLHKPAPDGVERQVPRELLEVRFVIYRHGHEPVTDGMAGSDMNDVEQARVATVQAPHTVAQGELGRPQYQMPVRVHQAVRPHLPPIRLGRLSEQTQATVAVVVIPEHRLAVVAVDRDVLNGSLVIDAWWSRHA